MKSFQHRDLRKPGIVTADSVYPFVRDHLHFPEHVGKEGLEPPKVRELSYRGVDPVGLPTRSSSGLRKRVRDRAPRGEAVVAGA